MKPISTLTLWNFTEDIKGGYICNICLQKGHG